jgi:ethanolamine permease
MKDSSQKLKPTLNALHLWGIAVGLVISGEYFGWSYGWASAGTLGFLVVTLFVAIMYTCFIFSFTELTTSIPHAGGPFAYAKRAFGDTGGFFAGASTLIEFVFAPPAIALAIGSYLQVQFPEIQPKEAAVGAYIIFMLLNMAGMGIAATFELFVTILAILELLVFMLVVSPKFSISNFVANGWAGSPNLSTSSLVGLFSSIPFAIWFFLAIEGAAMAAEEARETKRTIPIAYISAILTLVSLALGVMIFAGGVGDWRELSNINDPLPRAMQMVVGESSVYMHMLVWIGLFGLIASFHGIIMGYSRQIYALSRAGYMPSFLSILHKVRKTPYMAIIVGGIVGIIAIFSEELISIGGQSLTGSIITMSVFGALTSYIISLFSLFRLRKTEPKRERPFKTPLYPYLPLIALVLAFICITTMIILNFEIFLVYLSLLILGYIYYKVTHSQRKNAEYDYLLDGDR